MQIKWSYGVTTCPERRNDLLPKTLQSLRLAGFSQPRLFVDGSSNHASLWSMIDSREYEVTLRSPRIRPYGNWILALWELYAREPAADRYAIFQDDIVMSMNVKEYIDCCTFPTRGYLNLYTFPSNQSLVPADSIGWYESRVLESGQVLAGRPQQTGRGAVALVFCREGVQTLLASRHAVLKPTDSNYGHRKIDGAVCQSMNEAGWREYVHNPSLTQHTGDLSSMGNSPHKKATSFRGEDFDAMSLIRKGENSSTG